MATKRQRRRLLAAMADALGEHGYAKVTAKHVCKSANVSTATFYKQFGDLWDCLFAAYVGAAGKLCAEIEAACAHGGDDARSLATGMDAALAFFATQPSLGQLLSAPAPREASGLCAPRRLLISRLAAMLRRTRGVDSDSPQPPGLDKRLIDATLAFLHTRLAAGDAEHLTELGPELVAILDRPRVAA